MQKEIDVLSKALANPTRPFVAIVGGSKVSTKIAVLESLLTKVDTLIIGGAMAFTFLKAQGLPVGKSLVEDDKLDTAKALLNQAKALGKTLILPEDVVVADAFSEQATISTVASDAIDADLMGLDIGPKSIQRIESCIESASMLLWNGPVGAFEMKPFSTGTFAIAKALARSSAYTIIGGGDSISAIEQSGLADKMDHMSTGGGACLEFLEGKVLPGIEVVQQRV